MMGVLINPIFDEKINVEDVSRFNYSSMHSENIFLSIICLVCDSNNPVAMFVRWLQEITSVCRYFTFEQDDILTEFANDHYFTL